MKSRTLIILGASLVGLALVSKLGSGSKGTKENAGGLKPGSRLVPIEDFSRHWEANPLFATQAALAPELRGAMRRQRLAQDPGKLAAALRAFGTGFQPALHDGLARLEMPVLAMAGSLDTKFAAIARDMAGRIPGARLVLVPDAGHAVPLERAQAFAAELDAFLQGSIDA